MDRLAQLDVGKIVAYTPETAQEYFAGLASTSGNASCVHYELVPQIEGSLGDRLKAFLAPQLAAGRRIVVLGMDSPTVPLEFIEQAFADLERAEVVLGPALDGGYYLLGCRGRFPPIFDGIAWGGSTVLADTVARLTEAQWKFATLPPWYDIDSGEDLQLLQSHIAAMRRAGIDPEVPRVERMLKEMPSCT
jgi:hypothetical protein